MKSIEDEFRKLTLEGMGKTLQSLKAIQEQKLDARRKELRDELAKLEQISSGNGGGHVVGNPRSPGKRASPSAKYRDPKSGATWAGRGGTPKWMRAYEAEGKSRDDFLI